MRTKSNSQSVTPALGDGSRSSRTRPEWLIDGPDAGSRHRGSLRRSSLATPDNVKPLTPIEYKMSPEGLFADPTDREASLSIQLSIYLLRCSFIANVLFANALFALVCLIPSGKSQFGSTVRVSRRPFSLHASDLRGFPELNRIPSNVVKIIR